MEAAFRDLWNCIPAGKKKSSRGLAARTIFVKGGMGRVAKRPVPLRMTESLVLKPIPELTGQHPFDRLLNFYWELGWNAERKGINPKLVKIYADDLEKIITQEIDHAKHVKKHVKHAVKDVKTPDIAEYVVSLWMSNGPSNEGSIPGFVELHPGWEKEEL